MNYKLIINLFKCVSFLYLFSLVLSSYLSTLTLYCAFFLALLLFRLFIHSLTSYPFVGTNILMIIIFLIATVIVHLHPKPSHHLPI